MTWALHMGDCLDPVTGLASLPDQSIDHVITDPPYSARLYARTRTNKGAGVNRRNGRSSYTSAGEARAIQQARDMADGKIGAIDGILDEVAAQILRVTRRWIIVFHDVEIGHRWRDQLGDAYVRAGAWVKTNPMPQVTGDRPAQGFEPASIAHGPTRKRWHGGGRAAVWTYSSAEIDRPDHPCPKPLALMEELVRDFTDRGETILDPFSGSGTTGVACVRLGRSFVGWERDAGFHEAAARRLAATREQGDLFERPARRAKQESLL